MSSARELPLLYRGSVKDLYGPVQTHAGPGIVFDYSDAYSVFDWGRMPDLIAGKGRALARLASYWLSELEKPQAWQEFSRSPSAQALRKASRFGAAFNELGEDLQKNGLRTHLLAHPADLQLSDSQILVREVKVHRPSAHKVLGREVYDYTDSRAKLAAETSRLVPLEVVFRFSAPEGSSLLSRVQRDPEYLSSIGFPGVVAVRGARWDFPVLELFTKLESTDRLLSLQEASLIAGVAGLDAKLFEQLLYRTAWVAAFLRDRAERAGVELADGKLEWALHDGQIILVDAIGPDELRLLKDGVQLSKEFLRDHYRRSTWYQKVSQAKQQAQAAGVMDWKKGVPAPEALPGSLRDLASELYASLTARLMGEQSDLESLVRRIRSEAS